MKEEEAPPAQRNFQQLYLSDFVCSAKASAYDLQSDNTRLVTSDELTEIISTECNLCTAAPSKQKVHTFHLDEIGALLVISTRARVFSDESIPLFSGSVRGLSTDRILAIRTKVPSQAHQNRAITT